MEEMERKQLLTLDGLPVDVIITIFHYLDEKSLCRIAQVCRNFNHLASNNILWTKWKNAATFVSNDHWLQISPQPSYKEQCRLSKRWRQGKCKTRNVLKFEKNYLPWLWLSEDTCQLYLAVGDSISRYKSECWTDGNRCIAFQSRHPSAYSNAVVHPGLDVVRFSVDKKFIVTGGWHGALSVAARDEELEFSVHRNAHESDLISVALFGDVIVSGSRDRSYKIWKIDEDNLENLELRTAEDVRDTVLSVSINKHKRMVAVGTGGVGGVHPLQIKDLESGRQLFSLGESFKNGAGVLDSHFQTPDLLMTTGYDTYVRRWDMRTRSCVQSWEEPHDNTVYCVSSDNRYGFVSGSCRHGVTRVWDIRMRNCVQTFYLGGKVSSPVYTVGFTHSHLFAGLARTLFVLDFR